MSVRKDVAAQFTADWKAIPELAGLRVLATERAVEYGESPTAVIRWQTYTDRSPSNPQGRVSYGLILAIVSPAEDPDVAADQLDVWAVALGAYLGPRYAHDPMSIVGVGGYLALETSFTVYAAKG